MGMDPAGVDPNDPRTFNRFAYANNNPYKYVDPDGRTPLNNRQFNRLSNPHQLVDAGYGAPGLRNSDGLAFRESGGFIKVPNLSAAGSKGVGGAVKSPAQSPKVKKVLDGIKQNNFKVTINKKNPATKQEGNATIDFGDKTKVNLRVESHPLKQNGPDVRHANVETTKQFKNKNKVTSNKHITDWIKFYEKNI